MKIPLLSRLFGKRSSLANPESWLVRWFAGGGPESAAGVSVTPKTALYSTAVYACVRILAETVASLPLHVYRRLPGGGKERATQHYLYPVLHHSPNPEMTAFELREALMGHLLLWGNAYCEIEYDGAGRVIGLWPLRPDRMVVERGKGVSADTDWDTGGRLRYRYTLATGQEVILPAERVMHLRGLSFNGIIGYSPIALAREAIGLARATEEFGARFFGQGTHPGGIVEHPGRLSPEAHERLKKSLAEKYSGLGKSHRLLILEEGMSWKQVGIPPEDAQFLETRKFQVTEIARIFRVPPHMLADLERATFSNIEHQSIEFVVHTVRPWLVRWEQAILRDLVPPEERNSIFAEHLVDGLLRGDIKSRYEAYAVGRQNGWLCADDIREMENMNPLPDGQGKVYLIPLNMIPASQAGTVEQQRVLAVAQARSSLPEVHLPALGEDRAVRAATTRRRAVHRYERLFYEREGRIVKREAGEIRKLVDKLLARRDETQFLQSLEQFYREHRDYTWNTWLPLYLTYADEIQAHAAEEIGAGVGMTPAMEEFVRAYLTSHVALHINSAEGQLRQIVAKAAASGEDAAPLVLQRLEEWVERRPGKVARAETVQACGAVARETYRQNGIRKIRWVNFNPSCPYCQHLDGKVVGIESSFLSAGTDLQPEGADKPLRTDVDVHHPPAHGGCDCQIAAAV